MFIKVYSWIEVLRNSKKLEANSFDSDKKRIQEKTNDG